MQENLMLGMLDQGVKERRAREREMKGEVEGSKRNEQANQSHLSASFARLTASPSRALQLGSIVRNLRAATLG